jgi:macrolide-specific efflux system membrane fusion protein
MNAQTSSVTVSPATTKAAASRSRRGYWRWLLPVLAVLVVAGAGGAYFMLNGSQQTAKKISTVVVSKGDVTETVLATGTLQARSLVSVGAQVSGIVKTINVALGDTVKAGDVIAEIDSLDQENALKRANAALLNIEAQRAAEQANLAKLQRALDRAAQLNEKGMVAQSDFDTAQAGVDASQAQIKALDAQIETANLNVSSAELDLSRTKITAPSNGTVVAVLVDQGQTVNAAQTAPTIVKIADLDTMQIKAEISEADVTRVQPGQSVYFTILGDPDHRIDATLKSIEPAPESISSDSTTSSSDTAIYYNGIFEVPNPNHTLRISMTAQVTIVLDAANGVLTLPASALGAANPDGTYTVQVYNAKSGATETRQVTVGLNNKVTAQIVSGLSEGERVVAKSGAGATGGTAAAGGTNGNSQRSGAAMGPPVGL